MTDTAATEEETPELPQKDEGLANKHGFIDLDKIKDPDTRQQVQDRLSGLYRSQKESASALGEMQRLYSGMEKKLSEMEQGQQQKKTETELETVRKGIADANAKGEYEKAAELQEKMVDLKTPKPEPPKPDDGLSRAQEDALFSWQAEITDDGRLLRPWANPRHAKYRETIALLTEASQNPEIASQGFSAVLDAVHEKMTPKPKQASPVTSGDATPPRSSGKTTKLTPQQERVAKRMYPNEKDPLKAYAEAMKKYGEA